MKEYFKIVLSMIKFLSYATLFLTVAVITAGLVVAIGVTSASYTNGYVGTAVSLLVLILMVSGLIYYASKGGKIYI